MTPIDLLLIGVIIMVLLLVYYFMGRKRTPIEIPQEIDVAALKPPKQSLKIFTGLDTEVKMLSTVDELEKAVDDIVEDNMADRKAINEEATRLEERIIDDQKVKLQDLKTASETVIVEKKEELSASQKLLAEMVKKKEKKMLEREMLLQKSSVAGHNRGREKNRIENEKKLAEIKLKRQQAIEAMKQATTLGEAKRLNLQEENERLLVDAQNKAAQDLIRAEEEAVEAENVAREKVVQLSREEAQAQERIEAEIEKYRQLEMEYERTQQAEQAKIDAAVQDMDALIEEETARKAATDEEYERIRAERKQKLLDDNAAVIAELEKLQAEYDERERDALELKTKAETELRLKQEQQQRDSDEAQRLYDEQVARDQAAMDDAQLSSRTTGDADQQADRDAASSFYISSEEDWLKMTDEEKQLELDTIAAWNSQSQAREIMPSEYTYADWATEAEEERMADLLRRQALWDQRKQELAEATARQEEILEQCKKDYPWSANYPDFFDKPKWTKSEGRAMIKLKEASEARDENGKLLYGISSASGEPAEHAYWGTKMDCWEREHAHWKSTGQDYMRRQQATVLDADLLANFDDVIDDYNANYYVNLSDGSGDMDDEAQGQGWDRADRQ